MNALTRLAVLGTLAATASCDVDHPIGRVGYHVDFSARDDGGDSIRLEAIFDGSFESLVHLVECTCDGVQLTKKLSPFAQATRTYVLFEGDVRARQIGEVYTCVASWPEGEHTFRLPHFEAPVLRSPAPGAALNISAPVDFQWLSSSNNEQAVAGLVGLELSYCLNASMTWVDLPESGTLVVDLQTLLDGQRSLCPARATLSRTWTIQPISEGVPNQGLGFEDVTFSFVGERSNEFTVAR